MNGILVSKGWWERLDNPPQGNQQPLVVRDTMLEDPRWVWGKIVHGMWYFFPSVLWHMVEQQEGDPGCDILCGLQWDCHNMPLPPASGDLNSHPELSAPMTWMHQLKTHLFKRAYIWLLPPRTIEEWTYLLSLSRGWCGFNRGWIHHGHILCIVTRASIRHATPANVLVLLKDVKHEGIWKWLHVHPTTNDSGPPFPGSAIPRVHHSHGPPNPNPDPNLNPNHNPNLNPNPNPNARTPGMADPGSGQPVPHKRGYWRMDFERDYSRCQ